MTNILIEILTLFALNHLISVMLSNYLVGYILCIIISHTHSDHVHNKKFLKFYCLLHIVNWIFVFFTLLLGDWSNNLVSLFWWLPCYEQRLLNSIINCFRDVFPKWLLPKCSVDHKIYLILDVVTLSIPPYQLQKNGIVTQLMDYSSMGLHIRHQKSPWGAIVILFK